MKKKTSMEWDPLAGAGENARLRLPGVTAEFFALGRAAAQPGSEPVRLHAFRLAAKRFRYTLEIFRPVYGPGLDVRLEAVRKIQTMLGDRQDFSVLSARLRNTLAPSDTLLETLRACEEKGRALEEQFGAYWREEFDTAGAELRWVRYLTRRPAAERTEVRPAAPAATVQKPQRRPSRTARTRR